MKNFRYMTYIDANLHKDVATWHKINNIIGLQYSNDFNSIISAAKLLSKATGFDIIVEDRFSRKEGKAICYVIKPFMKGRIKKIKSNGVDVGFTWWGGSGLKTYQLKSTQCKGEKS